MDGPLAGGATSSPINLARMASTASNTVTSIDRQIWDVKDFSEKQARNLSPELFCPNKYGRGRRLREFALIYSDVAQLMEGS